MYTWTDEDGNLHFSDSAPTNAAAKRLGVGEETCSLKAELDQTEGGIARQLFLSLLGGKEEEIKKLAPEYTEFFTQYKAEKDKCRDGDKKACSCIASIAKEGATSITPTGNLLEKSP
jgi:hypothetical protein